MFKKRYIISYYFSNKNGFGFGHTFITTRKRINSFERINEIFEGVKGENKLDEIVVINFSRIKG